MAKKKATSENKVKLIAIAVAAGLVLAAAGFGSGYIVGAKRVSEAEQEGAAAVQEVTGRLESTETRLEGELGDLPGVIDRKVNKDSIELVLSLETSPQIILDRVRDRGITINRFEITTPSLNEIFLNIAGGKDE